jgi:hypothetical protein
MDNIPKSNESLVSKEVIYKWPRDNIDEYKFDVCWPYDVNPNDIVVPFTSLQDENKYRLSQRKRLYLISIADKRDRKERLAARLS